MNLDDYSFQMPGRIVEYFPATQTATVKISTSRTYSTVEDTDQQVEQGLLYDVPTFTPGGGGWHMTFPIKEGNPCMLSFSQFGYDHWLYKNLDAAGFRGDGHPQSWTRRRFSLADGFAQVGWNNIPTAIADYHETASQWRNEDATQVISMNADLSISITSPTVIQVNAATSVDIVAPLVNMSANLTVVGKVTAGSVEAPSMKVDGIEVDQHNHTNPEGGDVGPMK